MKIAVTSAGPNLEDQVEARFGRCPYFLIIDPDSMAVDALPNPNISLGGGAGPQSAQLMADQGVAVVLTGNCGPNAFRAFGAFGINVITGVNGVVREAVVQFKAGRLVQSSSASVQSHFGMGKGCGGGGRGMGGGGRGMGGGGGMGMGARGLGVRQLQDVTQQALDSDPINLPPTQDKIEQLKSTAANLRSQLKAIEDQLKILSTGK